MGDNLHTRAFDMSQKIVYDLLTELGGRASLQEIKALALKKYPEYTLYHYVSNRLHKLEHRGYVKKRRDGDWQIVRKRGPKV